MQHRAEGTFPVLPGEGNAVGDGEGGRGRLRRGSGRRGERFVGGGGGEAGEEVVLPREEVVEFVEEVRVSPLEMRDGGITVGLPGKFAGLLKLVTNRFDLGAKYLDPGELVALDLSDKT